MKGNQIIPHSGCYSRVSMEVINLQRFHCSGRKRFVLVMQQNLHKSIIWLFLLGLHPR